MRKLIEAYTPVWRRDRDTETDRDRDRTEGGRGKEGEGGEMVQDARLIPASIISPISFLGFRVEG